MKFYKIYSLLFLVLASACGEEKNITPKQWFKGNLHTHSYWSDGDEFPEVIMDWYKSNDYEFVALTDHNTLAEGDKWKVIAADTMYQKAFTDYLDTYGSDWVKYRKDSLNGLEVKLKTCQEYKGRFEEKEKFLIIQSYLIKIQ
jgi:histidinol phosphatase-like PHP family hydrolase